MKLAKNCFEFGMMDARDRISDLPDGIISSILSLMTLKKAATTSVLSRRWKYLWTCHPRLIFDMEADFPRMRRDAFEKMIDYVVHHHPKGVTLQEFCVRYNPNGFSKSLIDNWLDFALSVGASKVVVDVLGCWPYSVPSEVFCDPNTRRLVSTELMLAIESAPPPPPPPSYRNCFTSLRELFLSNTNVTDGVFEVILSSCALLECLLVTHDRHLRSAKCTVPHLNLKHMTLQCTFLEDLEIVAPNLISINYYGPRANLCIGGGSTSLVSAVILSADKQKDFLFGPLSAHTSRLECLTLDTGSVLGRIERDKVPSLRNLRMISLADMFGFRVRSLLLFHRAALCMLGASPLLQRFELHLIGLHTYDSYDEGRLLVDEHENTSLSLHQNLEEFMLTGFAGYDCEMKFLMLIASRSTALESVEVSTRFSEHMVDSRGSYIHHGVVHTTAGKKDIEKLRSVLPSNVRVKYLK